jgi:hypothetical protein
MSDQMSEPTSDQPAQEKAGPRRHPTLKMASLAVQNMVSAGSSESNRAGMKDLASEILLPVSCVLLIVAICISQPIIKGCTFLLPIAALSYYLYRRIGVVSTFNSRQAYLMRCLLLATFALGGTFALFFVFVAGYWLRP